MIDEKTNQVDYQVNTETSQVSAPRHYATQPQGMEAQQFAPNVQASAVVSSETLSSTPQIPQPTVPAFHSGASMGTSVPAATPTPGGVTASGQSGCAFRSSQAAAPDTSQLEDLLSGFRTSKNSKLVYSIAEIGMTLARRRGRTTSPNSSMQFEKR